MSRRLEELQIYQTIQMTYPLRSLDERSITMPDPNQDFVWEKDSYLWFGISGLEGGIDGYCRKTTGLTRELWDEFFELPHFARRKELALECLATGHSWAFRRSMGQLGITNLLHGILAGSIAKLTDGLILSDDSAWEWEKMPYTADEFIAEFFVPERTADPRHRGWAEECLKNIARELTG